MKSLSAVLMGLAARGYRWYLALKVVKAIFAVPFYVAWIAVFAVVAVGVAIYMSGRAVFWELPWALFLESREFWQKKWFRGFSRNYYRSLTHYKSKPVALRPVDIA